MSDIKLISRETITRAPSTCPLNKWSETYIQKLTYSNGKEVFVLNTHTKSSPMDDIYRAWFWFTVDTGVTMPEEQRQPISREEYDAKAEHLALRVAGKTGYGLRKVEADAELSLFRVAPEAVTAETIINRALHVAANSFGHVIGEHEDLVEELRAAGFNAEADQVEAAFDTVGGANHNEIRANWRKAIRAVLDGHAEALAINAEIDEIVNFAGEYAPIQENGDVNWVFEAAVAVWARKNAMESEAAHVCHACACLIANDDADNFSNSFTEGNARKGIAAWRGEWATLAINHEQTDRDTSFKCECCGERIHGEKFHLVLANFRK